MLRFPLIFACVLVPVFLPSRVLALQDTNPEAPRSKALALEKQGLTSEAEQIWQNLAKGDPRNAEALGHLGLLEARQEHYESAIDYYRRAAAINPDLPGLEMNLGLALFKAAQFPDAIKIFSSQIENHPGDQRLTILLGMAHYGLKDYLVAIPWLRRAADNDPQNAGLRLTLAHSCMESNQYPCVIKVHQEIQALHAESPDCDILAAQAFDQMHDTSAAGQQLRAALLLNPQEPNAHFALGYLLWAQNNFAQAANEFELELQNNPQNATARLYLTDAQQQRNHASPASPHRPGKTSLQDLIEGIENPAP